METIHNSDGNVIQRSRNLAGIRRFVRKNEIGFLAIDAVHAEGRLAIFFRDGSSFRTEFASCVVLKRFVRQWRAVYGARLMVQGEDRGTISHDNPALS